MLALSARYRIFRVWIIIEFVTLLHGFAFSGYRSFSSEKLTDLSPLGKVNLIAGQNNAGKSNILKVIADCYGEAEPTLSRWGMMAV